ncbi:hypothetical protein [Xanthobacter sp. VNH20]|uniref:hypothetical protein n=1 Tax=Xanthobacter sp. VNH20 TaxID=3156616 RepID=UPI0032B31B1E
MNTATSQTDPVLALLTEYRAACATFNSKPEDDTEEWAQSTWRRLQPDMENAPIAQSLAGAIAALEFAEREEVDFMDSPATIAFIRSALGFLRKFDPPAPRTATRAELEAYNEWLHMERRLLAAELYPELGYDAERFVPVGTGAEELHLPQGVNWAAMPSPSTRAIPVLMAVGANFDRIRKNSDRFLSDTEAACMAGALEIAKAERGAQ